MSSREFIALHYSWFLPTFDGYRYPIQRADAIRYFVLHYYGGIYLDLDVGCLKRVDPLLSYGVILPRTIPVGVSNDLMFAERGHPFMEQAITNLISFNHDYILNYPTVMFSTGPMFVSAQYGIYTTAHPPLPGQAGDVRILPKSLYGKNAAPGEAPNSFFEHHYGSSWHSDDAAFITFLGRWGRYLMVVGGVVVALGFIRAALVRRSSDGWRRKQVYLRLDFFPAALSGSVTPAGTRAPSPVSSEATTPPQAWVPVLPFAFTPVRASSPSPRPRGRSSAMHALSWAWSKIVGRADQTRKRSRSLPRSTNRGMTLYMPAVLESGPSDYPSSHGRRTPIPPSRLDIEKGSISASHPYYVPPSYDPRFQASRLAPLQAPPPYPYEANTEWRRKWDSWSPDGADNP